MAGEPTFHEALPGVRIRDLGLTIDGTRLEPIVAAFTAELLRIGIHRLQPQFYLSTEWGVPFGTVSIAIPFYLARPDLAHLHAERVGHVEGVTSADILRYLRHEMGHVVNYAYRLYDREDWVEQFGSMTQPYEDEYRPQPFSLQYVRHLPGWYAQKHPDEDWAETFAVWMTPGFDWNTEYRDWPVAHAKLAYCDRTMRLITTTEPIVTATDRDEDAAQLEYSLEHYYHGLTAAPDEQMPPLDGPLRAIFEEVEETNSALPAVELIHRIERGLAANVYRWTGHFPERTLRLLHYLATRAEALKQVYAAEKEQEVVVGLTTLVTALAMNFVYRGSYIPASEVAKSG